MLSPLFFDAAAAAMPLRPLLALIAAFAADAITLSFAEAIRRQSMSPRYAT